MDAFGVVNNLTQDDFYKTYFYTNYDKVLSLGVVRTPYGTITTVQSEDYPKKLVISRRFSFRSKRYLSRLRYLHCRPSPFSSLQISRKKL